MRTADTSNNSQRTVTAVLAQQASSIGDDLFLLDDSGAQLTYRQVDESADRFAQGFGKLGVEKGDTVALFMENSAAQVVSAFGANRLGAIWSPVNTDYRGEWLGVTFDDIGSTVLVIDAHLIPEVQKLENLPFKHIIVSGSTSEVVAGVTTHDISSFDDLAPVRPNVDVLLGDTSGVLWTSGTTGKSKGVMQPHNAWIHWSEYHNEHFRRGIRDGERFYGCTPMYNSGGWIMNVFPALLSGTQACIDKRFSVNDFWDRLRHYDANHTMTLGAMHVFLALSEAKDDDADNPLRTLVMNPVIPGILEPFMERFDVERVASGFGQSEIMGATLWRDDLGLSQASAGLANTDTSPVEVALLDADDLPVPQGEQGEIAVRGKAPFVLFSGYFNEPETTLETFRNLWHHTGDLGRIDENGELYFVDRKKDSTRYKGRNISTFEVESIARRVPGAAMVAVVGIPSDVAFEDELMLAIVPAPDVAIDPLEVCKFIDENAPYFFVPRYVWVTSSLPMTPTNKVQKYKIREAGLPSDAWDLESQSEWRPTKKDYRNL